MISQPLIIIAFVIVGYGVFSRVLSTSFISAPMAFMLTGLALGGAGLGWFNLDLDNEALEGFGEITLGLILFADAASTNSRRLLSDNKIPLRLLMIALPLSIGFGAVVAHLLFPSLGWAEKALIAAILAPTDAALGYAVVTSKAVPERIRQGILVESGLNDGLALPAVLLFAALAYSGAENAEQGLNYWLAFTGAQISIGAFIGVGGGYVLGKIIHWADGQRLIAHEFKNLVCIGVALILLFGAHLANGNGFIAAFVGGLVFGGFCKERAGAFTGFVEEEGQLFSLLIFFFFGAVILPDAAPFITVYCVAYALLSLTVIRMASTYLSLSGARLSFAAKGFIGWFGPRGLASILFLFIAVEHSEMERLSEVEAIVYVTVALSVILHGVSAPFLSRRYGASGAAVRDASAG